MVKNGNFTLLLSNLEVKNGNFTYASGQEWQFHMANGPQVNQE